MSTAGKLGLLFLCSIQSANAYELSTHTAITFNALQRSKLASADQLLLKDLGIDGIVLDPAPELFRGCLTLPASSRERAVRSLPADSGHQSRCGKRELAMSDAS